MVKRCWEHIVRGPTWEFDRFAVFFSETRTWRFWNQLPGEQQAIEEATESQRQAAKDRPEGRNSHVFVLESWQLPSGYVKIALENHDF